ncbi:MAG: proline racemase family protein [Phyllobacteriaceae bacterium]|nr:proline racemase family protein [Phyllobacteriaceae bacterium]
MIPLLTVDDMHTGGEPVRIVVSGWPPVPGASILEKRAFVRANHDHLRRILMFEPRGHADMYGALLVEPSLPGAELAVLFMHNEGWSTMCGHATIALGRYAVEKGLVAVTEPVTRIGLECPCGLVRVEIAVADGKVGGVSFESVPAFLSAADLAVDLPGHGRVVCDVAYGGAFYALADCCQFGLEFGRDRIRDFVDAATALSDAVRAAHRPSHPDSADLEFLYGSILTDGGDGRAAPTKNVCVFADSEVDRSPTGSGVTARLAAMHAKGQTAVSEIRVFESITGARFDGRVMSVFDCGDRQAVTVGVSGRSHWCGRAEFIVEPDDPLGGGFLLR